MSGMQMKLWKEYAVHINSQDESLNYNVMRMDTWVATSSHDLKCGLW